MHILFPPNQCDRLLTVQPVRKLTDIMTILLFRERKRRLHKSCYCANSITGDVFTPTMVIVSNFTLVLKESETSVFC
jgi:hypothetical protein